MAVTSAFSRAMRIIGIRPSARSLLTRIATTRARWARRGCRSGAGIRAPRGCLQQALASQRRGIACVLYYGVERGGLLARVWLWPWRRQRDWCSLAATPIDEPRPGVSAMARRNATGAAHAAEEAGAIQVTSRRLP